MARLVALARAHRLLLIVLAGAIVLRVLVEIAYWPALTFSDSWQYIQLAFANPIVAFGVDRPSGYPLILHLLALPGRSLGTISIVQHLAGLATGIIAYWVLRRLGIRAWAAALAAALILFDSYVVTLEQTVLAETFFALALLLAAALAVLYSRSPWTMAAAGVLLAGAVTLRVAALFAIPAFVLFVLIKGTPGTRAGPQRSPVSSCRWRRTARCTRWRATASASREQVGGWGLYGRVAPIADCRGASIPAETKPLCQTAAERERLGFTPSSYVFSPESPARRAFGFQPPNRVAGELQDFALGIIAAHPLAYAGKVTGDFVRLFEPGGAGVDSTLTMPRRGLFAWETVYPEALIRDKYFPGFYRQIREPDGFLLAYQRVFHTPRWLMGIFLLAIVAAAVTRFFGRPRASARGAYLLFGGMAFGLLLGPVATVELNVRFLVPAVPLLVCGGFLALRDLALVVSRSLAPARAPTPPSVRPAR